MILTILSGWVFAEKRILGDQFSLKKLWEDWEVQILVILSLIFQTILIGWGSRRKYYSGRWLDVIRLFTWSAYLLADWVATVALGVLFKKQRNSGTGDSDDELMSFWAPFLLLHLGGPDTITAYAIADNELWIRHLLGLCVQTGVASYITYTAWTGTWLSLLTIPMLIAGFIKYVERSLALRSANREQFHDSLLDPPDSGPNYTKFMEEFNLKKDEGFSVSAIEVAEAADQSFAGSGDNDSAANTNELLPKAYSFFLTFRRLFVDLILSFHDRDKSQSYFQNSSPKDAFELVEIELGFAYDAFYTKAPIIYTTCGCVFRFITSFITIIVFVLLLFVEKHNHLRIDLIITYILLAGAIILDFYAVILLLFSDRTNLCLSEHKRQFSRNFCCFQPMLSQVIACFQRIVSKQVSSFLPFNKKRWSNSLAQFNLLTFSLKRNLVFFLDVKPVQKIVKHWYVRRCEISSDLKGLIFQHFQNKSKVSKDKAEGDKEKAEHDNEKTEDNKEKSKYDEYIASLCSARGGLVFKEKEYECHSSFKWSTEVEFDQSILIWHIATDLCYHEDGGEKFAAKNKTCQGSKNLSDYMLYLLVMCPSMLPMGIGMIRFQDTIEEIKEFSKEIGVSSKDKDELPTMLFEVCTEVEPTKVKGDRSKSVLFDGCRLANQLQQMVKKGEWNKEKKWEFVSNVWIEILGFAASHCRGYYHARQLAKGGELLTHVWLLMAHLGITEQFQINRGHARAKLDLK